MGPNGRECEFHIELKSVHAACTIEGAVIHCCSVGSHRLCGCMQRDAKYNNIIDVSYSILEVY